MSKSDSRRQARRSRLTRQLLMQYFFTLGAFCIGTLALIFGAWRFCSMFTWYADNPLYWALQFVKDYLPLFLGIIILIGWAVITYFFISRPLRYLDELVSAAERLAAPTAEPISLPAAMLDMENELNLLREKALNDTRTVRDAEQRKNDLIVYLAHDLKTPLTSVIGYLTLLQDELQLSPELRAKYTGIALSKAVRLEDLINEFFDITRFSLTSLAINRETINISRMLEQISFEFQPLLAEKGLFWNLQLEPDLYLLCDPDKLERVFDNLFRNAVHYSYPDTSIAVLLQRSGENAIIQVQNHGKTIPPEMLSHIFEQFFRLDSSRASTTGGAGLGLAIAREIVQLHGGTISAESADSQISFTVTLPSACKKIV